MAKTVICTLVAGQIWDKTGKPGTSIVAVLDVYSQTGSAPTRLSISQTQTLKLNYGDRIKCISGRVGVTINPGTSAGMFVLFADSASCTNWNFRTELEMNDETTKQIHRGEVSVADDIGNISRGTGASAR
jgi:hypothetical protein